MWLQTGWLSTMQRIKFIYDLRETAKPIKESLLVFIQSITKHWKESELLRSF